MVLYGVYSEECDMTFVMIEETKWNNGEPQLLQRVVDFYYGKPDEHLNKFYYERSDYFRSVFENSEYNRKK